jgi:hypothetical protein
MPVQDKDSLAGGASWNSIAGGLLMFTLMLVFMVWLGLYVNDGFESLEEKLGDQAAAGGQTIGNGAYGIEIVEGQTVYVPVYSHIYANGGQPHLLEATLSIRNLDPKRAITIKSVKYFDTKGALLKEYLDGEMELAALATAGFLVEKWDTRGGSGANFIVVWDAEEPVYEPLIEAVMVGFSDANSISFTSPGRALIERKEQTDSTP